MLFILKGKRYARMVMNIHLWFLKDPFDLLGEKKKTDSIGKRQNGKASEEVITQIQEKIMVVVRRW